MRALLALICACASTPRPVEPVDPPGPAGEWRAPPPARTITRPEVMEAMTHLASPFAQCRAQHTGEAHGRATVRWRFARTGVPRDVQVSDAPEALAACLSEAASSSLRVREHEVESNEVFDLAVKF